METASAEDLEDDSLEGAVIDSLEYGVGGLHLLLRDGRVLLFPDAEIVAIFRAARTLQ
jgi:hypothetical protein